MVKKTTPEEYISKAKAVHGDRYDYSKTKYTKSHDRIIVICREHGEFTPKAFQHLQYGCKKCGNEASGSARKTKIDDFVRRANALHESKYDYSRVSFKTQHDQIEIECPIHGTFTQAVNDHLKGHGCNRCGALLGGAKVTVTTEEFVARSVDKHGELYDYSESEYRGTSKKLVIKCHEHGPFEQLPHQHMAGYGCPECGWEKVALAKMGVSPINSQTRGVALFEAFVGMAREVHGDKYQYSEYTGMLKKTPIECPAHGVFMQTAADHVHSKAGCPACANIPRSSKKQNDWLDVMGVKEREVPITLINGRRIIADGYDPKTKTVYEFWGDYWHGHTRYSPEEINKVNGKTFGELRELTIRKKQAIIDAGYKLVEIWETDWDNINGKKKSIDG